MLSSLVNTAWSRGSVGGAVTPHGSMRWGSAGGFGLGRLGNPPVAVAQRPGHHGGHAARRAEVVAAGGQLGVAPARERVDLLAAVGPVVAHAELPAGRRLGPGAGGDLPVGEPGRARTGLVHRVDLVLGRAARAVRLVDGDAGRG